MTVLLPSRLWRASLDLGLRKKVAVVFIAMLVFAGLNVGLLHRMLQDFNGVAATATVAGKMRMLGQKLAYETVSLGTVVADNYENIEHDIVDFEAAYLVLRSGGAAFGEMIRPLAAEHASAMNSVWLAWQQYRDQIRGAVAASAKAGAAGTERYLHLDRASATLFDQTDLLIQSLVQEAQSTQQRVLGDMYMLLVVNALGLLVAYLAMSTHIVAPLQRLARHCRELARGNYWERTLHEPNDEIGQLAQALNQSGQQIGELMRAVERERKELRRTNAMFQGVARNTVAGVFVMDGAMRFRYVNRKLAEMFGYKPEEMADGLTVRDLLAIPGSDGMHSLARNTRLSGGAVSSSHYETRAHHRDGTPLDIEVFVSRMALDGAPAVIGIVLNVTERKRAEETVWRQAHFDHLTGLPNRQMFHEALKDAMEQADLTGHSLALIYLDLDHFKDINDSLGHAKGDELLKDVARRLRRAVRQDDVVARLGGDEFTLIVNNGDDAEAVEDVCRRVLEVVSEPYPLGESMAVVSASLGVTLYPRDAGNVTDLLKSADLAMYSAKDGGRGRHRYFSLVMQREAQGRRELLRELQEAVDSKEFELYYQPIIDLTTGRICKAEALLRWHHPRRGMVPPIEFIPLAEDSGMIVPIGDWVFRTAAAQVAKWRGEHDPDFQVSVNVSPVQFMADELDPAEWIMYVNSLGMPGSSVLVEITERLLMKVDGVSRNKLLVFRDAGVQVALDDFGTGYSSLSYLKRFDIDFIKIDQLFVRNITEDSDDLALCQAIIAMAHRLGLKVVAEGVSTEAQHDLLIQAGCDYVQGFLYSQPLPAGRFEQLLQADEVIQDAGRLSPAP